MYIVNLKKISSAKSKTECSYYNKIKIYPIVLHDIFHSVFKKIMQNNKMKVTKKCTTFKSICSDLTVKFLPLTTKVFAAFKLFVDLEAFSYIITILHEYISK